MIRQALGLAAVLLAGTGAAAAADRALIVGIDLYPKILVDGVANQRNLAGAVNDARRMADVATRVFGFDRRDVVFLSDLDATRAGILKAFKRELIDRTRPGDRVLFYYAGHGAQVVDASGDEADDGLDEVLVPSDARAELAAADPTLDGVILDDEIDGLVSALKGREVTVIVDACHSGTITRAALAGGGAARFAHVRTLSPFGPLKLAPAARDAAARPGRAGGILAGTATARAISGGPKLAVWTAVASAQFALEDMSVGGSAGLFTSRFVRGLSDFAADMNGNGVVTPAELLDYLRVETELYCGKFDCLGQDPLPTLEAFSGYKSRPLATRPAEGDKVADAGAAAMPGGGATVVRTAEEQSAVPADLLPAHGEPVAVAIEGGPRMKVGTALKIVVTAPRAGRLVVLDRRDDGSVVQLYPNRYSAALDGADLVEAGATLRIPAAGAGFDLVADAPGRGTVTAFLLDPGSDVAGLLAQNDGLDALADPAAYGDALATAATRAIVVRPAAPAVERKLEAPSVARGDVAYEILP